MAPERFHAGGRRRGQRAGLAAPRRIVYVAASPLIPFVRARRISATPADGDRGARAAATSVLLLVALPSALGELAGTRPGPGTRL